MTQQWPRPFVIYEVEVLDRNVQQELWEQQKQEHGSGQSGVNSHLRAFQY
jgi:hypothetical protein